MLKRLAILGTSFALLGSAAAGIGVALAAEDISAPETIVSIEHTLRGGFVDVGRKGFSIGDELMFLKSMFDETDTNGIGTDRVVCTVFLRQWAWCSATIIIDGRGAIVADGAVPLFLESTAAIDLPITGGTGEFANVRGTVHDEFLTETTTRLTLNLIP